MISVVVFFCDRVLNCSETDGCNRLDLFQPERRSSRMHEIDRTDMRSGGVNIQQTGPVKHLHQKDTHVQHWYLYV